MYANALTVRQLSSMSKADLAALIKRESEVRWIIGGPDSMSRDEMVSHICRELPHLVIDNPYPPAA